MATPLTKKRPVTRVFVQYKDAQKPSTVSVPADALDQLLALTDGHFREATDALRHAAAAVSRSEIAGSASAFVRAKALSRLRGLTSPAKRLAAENNAAWSAQ